VFRRVRPVERASQISAYAFHMPSRSFPCFVVAQADRCDMQLPEGCEGSGFGCGTGGGLNKWMGTYCYGVVVLNIEVVIVVEIESVVVAIILVGHAHWQLAAR
jgi:hypothetical protein